MPVKIYLDVFLIVNVLMDFIVLHLTSSVAEWYSKLWREALAAFVGGMWAVADLIILQRNPDKEGILLFATYVIAPAVMVLIVKGYRGIGDQIRSIVTLYVVTFITAGICGIGWYYTDVGYGLMAGMIPTKHLLYALPTLLLIWIIMGTFVKKRKKYGRDLYKVVLTIEQKDIVLKGLLDTGNVLMDPYTGNKVNVVCKNAVREWAKTDFLKGTGKCRLVPFQSVGQAGGLLPVIDVECMRVYDKEKMIYCGKAEIGLCNENLSKNMMYDVLLHSGILS